jgi:DNA-binding beta-propeller fold protein YncE
MAQGKAFTRNAGGSRPSDVVVETSRYVEQARREGILMMEKIMRKLSVISLMLFGVFVLHGRAQQAPPLKLIQTIRLPNTEGNFSHFGLDLKGNRLFATLEKLKSVDVLDLRTLKLIHRISGIEEPASVFYRADLDRIYVSDDPSAALRIYDGKTYTLIKNVKLLLDAESIAYDAASKHLYVLNGGADEHQTYAMVSVVDTTAGEKVADIKVDGEALKGIAVEKSSPKIYVSNRAKNQIDVIDRERRAVVSSWPLTLCKGNLALALDEQDHRLFVACRSGSIVVFDTVAGKELQALPIGEGGYELAFNPGDKRIYAPSGAAGGSVDVYEETDPDHYKFLGKVPSGPLARTALLVPELHRYFVAVPKHENMDAEILVYATVGGRVRRR